MAIVICLNVVLLMVETDQISMQAEIILYWSHLVFILIFLIEFILKIIALRQHYFTDGWNVLDFLVLIFTIVGESARFPVMMSSSPHCRTLRLIH